MSTALKEKLSSNAITEQQNLKIKQNDYNTKFNPEEDISEPETGEHPEDLSALNFEISRSTQLNNCPDCNGKLEEITTGGLDPQDIIDILICLSCGWTERREMTVEEVLDRLEEIPYV